MKQKNRIRFFFLILIKSLSLACFAEDGNQTSMINLPDYYPEYFDNSAVLTEIDRKNGRLIFGAMHFPYDDNVKIKLLATEFGTVDQLQPGMTLAFSTHTSTNNKIKQI